MTLGKHDNVIPIRPGHRTPEQIRGQLEARYAQLEADCEGSARKYSCETCRWCEVGGLADYQTCHEPLVNGFDKPRAAWDCGVKEGFESILPAKLCGPEKALWQPIPDPPPKPNLLDRLIEWLFKRFPSLGDAA